MSALADAYSASSGAWERGPARIYDRLAVELVARCPGGVEGVGVVDIGTGRGAASRAALAAGARWVIGVDAAFGMIAGRPLQVGADARSLPFASEAIDRAVAAFSLNHLPDPELGLAEAARLLGDGGALAASAYADDDEHPVKQAVDAACQSAGWHPADWYVAMRSESAPLMATVAGATEIARRAGLTGAHVERVEVPFAELTADDLVRWRMGMAHVAPYLASLVPAQRAAVHADAMARLGRCPPILRRRMIVLTWQR